MTGRSFYVFLKQKIWDFIYPPCRFFRYLICGCGAAAINYFCFMFFCFICGFHFSLSMLLSTVITWVYSFMVNKIFVFEVKYGKTLRESIFFIAQQLLLFGAANGLMWICIEWLNIHKAISWLLVSGIILLFNFAGMKFLIWKKINSSSGEGFN